MSEQIEAGEGWRSLGPDESVDGFGDEHKTSEGVWVKVPSYFTLWKAKDFIAVRRRIPAKPEAMEIDHRTIKCNSFNEVMAMDEVEVWRLVSNPEQARTLADWLNRYAEWREAQGEKPK
jgi:hypothetical protein